MSLTLMDWFCGAGGSSQGAHAVPGVTVTLAANHWERAIESHAANFPETDHWRGDIREAPVHRWPVADIFWASPECPQWSNARGKARDFANSMQGELFGPEKDEEVERSRALMEEVPLYLRGVQDRGGLVLAGVVENVIDVRAWDQWDRWLGEIRKLGYGTRVIAMNSMHAHGTSTPAAPQSRDRLYVAYWHDSLGRTPDWDKWLRPAAWCSGCEAWVSALQVFKSFGADMGRYRQQYIYRCPRSTCRNAIVEPFALPALYAIDWTLPGQRIGDRAKPLADKTLARIRAGLEKYARPWILDNNHQNRGRDVFEPMPTQTTATTKGLVAPPLMVPAGGTWRNDATPVDEPMPTRTTRENDGIAFPPFITVHRGGEGDIRTNGIDETLSTVTASGNHLGLAVPPLLVPVEGREGKEASLATQPGRTQTARNETGLAWLPFVAELRGGGSDARSVSESLATVTASGNHHGLVAPYVHAPVAVLPPVEDVLFRMLEPHEIGAAMAFAQDYVVLGSKREKVRQYGNAVTPPVAELIVSALVEAITGEDLERAA